MEKNISKTNKILTLLFSFLSLLFIVLMAINSSFFEWTFARHQNVLSWYIRPLFLIPFCYFAFKHNPFGIALTIFLLLTSMFWFPVPVVITDQVREFLIMEKEYLTSNWTASRILISLLVPLSLGVLAGAMWKQSIKMGIGIVVIIAIAKTVWSVMEGGESGQAVIIPALIGLVLCTLILYYGFKWFKKNKKLSSH
jgi:hypothetical protein